MPYPTTRILQFLILLLLSFVVLFPFLITPSLKSVPSSINGDLPTNNNAKDAVGKSDEPIFEVNVQQSPRQCEPGKCDPRRYFAVKNDPNYHLEPMDSTGRNGLYSNIPSRSWDESSLEPLNYSSPMATTLIRKTMEGRLNALLESDEIPLGSEKMPKYLPPQFPQWDRSIHQHVASASTILGMPPECCPTNIVHQHLTKNYSSANVLSDEELKDCECRHPRNYPRQTGPTATLVTAFYQMSSKHPAKMYEKTSQQLLSTADPMIIFCEPGTKWVDFFVQSRQHAPTIVVPLPSSELRLVKHFPQETFWKKQYEIDPEAPTHHKGVNTMLYVIWDEKLVLVQVAGMLNPFNTTQFVWVDTGYWRNPGKRNFRSACVGVLLKVLVLTFCNFVPLLLLCAAPHLYRKSAVMINITEQGVNDESTLLFQMIPYNFKRDVVISGNQVLVGGNCFAGTYKGISNLYSAFYDTFWTMASTGKFVGSDQKVMYRTCHTYPWACHVHKPRTMRSWLKMLGELLPGIGSEKIGEPLRMKELIAPEEQIPVPPNGIVNDATSPGIWKGVMKKT